MHGAMNVKNSYIAVYTYVVGNDIGIYMLRLEKIIYRWMACPLYVHLLFHIQFK